MNEFNRARKAGLNLYCNRRCSGLGRRMGKTKAQRVAEKRAYDAEYRAKNREMLKAKKHEYFRRSYDPVAAAEVRKARMPYHVEYCRQPAYKAKKREYDRKHRAAEFGEFAEAYMLTIDLNREIKGRMTNEEIKWQSGTANKAQFRKREVKGGQERSRPRNRWSRNRNQAAHGQQSEGHSLGNADRPEARKHSAEPCRRHRSAVAGNPADGEDPASGRRPGQAASPAGDHRILGAALVRRITAVVGGSSK